MDHHHLLEEKSPRQNNNNNNNNNSNNSNNNGIMVSSSSSTFCYPNVTPSNYDPNPEMFHLTSGLEMIGFQPKQLNNNDPNDELSKGSEFFHEDHDNRGVGRNNNLMGEIALGGRVMENHHHQVGSFVNNDFALRSCVFPCEGNERPSQGLSLSLSSSNPSSIGVQSFELRTNNHNHLLNQLPNHQRFTSRDGFLGKSQAFQQQEFFLGKSGGNSNNSSGNSNNSSMSLQFEFVRNSKYMGPVQELLNEFCCLGTQQKQSLMMMKNKKKKNNKDDNLDLLHDDDDHQINDVNNASSSSSRDIYSSLFGLSMLDLQKRKTKLFGMLEELDRRYKHYCDQLKGIESSFESVAGHGTANVYTTLASKAMSRHFRCLRDSLVAQIKATKKAMGEKDGSSIVPGTTKGETPRLRILDQTLRQQRAFQQMTLMESHPWRPQRGLPERSVSVLRAWLFEHFLHPYPSDVDKHILARQTNLSRSQVSNWFINARVRLWKPMVEQMYLEETKEQQEKNMGSPSDATDHHLPSDHDGLIQDQKPGPDDLIRLDPDSFTSIINTTQNDNNTPHNVSTSTNLQQNQPFGRDEAFAYVALPDFPSSSSYTHTHASTTYGLTQNDNNAPHQGFGGGGTTGGNNVSLTLGLQQHGGNGVSLAFSPVSQGSLFYGRDHIDDCQQVHGYSLLEGDQAQNLPYRNLMDAQLLHDFTQ